MKSLASSAAAPTRKNAGLSVPSAVSLVNTPVFSSRKVSSTWLKSVTMSRLVIALSAVLKTNMVMSRRNVLRLVTLAASIAVAPNRASAAAAKIRIGVLKFGTVSWELDTLKHHGFDAANGIDLEISYFAGEDA